MTEGVVRVHPVRRRRPRQRTAARLRVADDHLPMRRTRCPSGSPSRTTSPSTSTDLSNFARTVEFTSEHERIDVSGFNATGAERVPRRRRPSSPSPSSSSGPTGPARSTRRCTRSTATGRSSRSSGGPTRPPPSSATNPQLTGNVQILTYIAGRHPRRGGHVRGRVQRRRRGRPRVRRHRRLMARPAGTLTVTGYKDLLQGARDRRQGNPARAPRHAQDRRGSRPARQRPRNSPPVDKVGERVQGPRSPARCRRRAIPQKTTGNHPEWGAYQMRHALIPARSENIDETDRRMEARPRRGRRPLQPRGCADEPAHRHRRRQTLRRPLRTRPRPRAHDPRMGVDQTARRLPPLGLTDDAFGDPELGSRAGRDRDPPRRPHRTHRGRRRLRTARRRPVRIDDHHRRRPRARRRGRTSSLLRQSSSSSNGTSGAASPTSSATPASNRSPTGTRASATSASAPVTSAS